MRPVILITMGDCNGIGPEVALKAVASPIVLRMCRPILVGSIDVFEFYSKMLKKRFLLREEEAPSFRNGKTRTIHIVNVQKFAKPRIVPGQVSAEAGRFAGEAIETAASLCLSGKADAMVTGPVSKEPLQAAGFRFPGQTEMIATLCGAGSATMMLIADRLRVALTTVHRPLKHVHRSITKGNVFRVLSVVHGSLRRDFALQNPRIAVLGLNPHAGENGIFGKEERREIKPAIAKARSRRMRVHGPFPADGFFGTHAYERYDAVLAMYHDQGLVPFKMQSFLRGVNFSAGLPIVRTSPDHGTAFDIAGSGVANPSSMIEAIRLAASIVNNRRGNGR